MTALAVAMGEKEARQVTQRIRQLLDRIANDTDKVLDLIDQARAGDAWKPLGYDSWTAYVDVEFGDALARLSRKDRIPAVVKMRELGMSTRAIGEVVGVDPRTVRRDLDSGGACAPPGAVVGRDGKCYVRNGKPTAAGMRAIAAAVPPPRETKTFAEQCEASKTRLQQAVERIVALAEDSRFPQEVQARMLERLSAELAKAARKAGGARHA